MAITNRQPVIAPVYHSERGTQYTSIAFSDRLQQLGLTPSMGSRGDAFDNALIESWHASLQTELLERQHWRYRDELRTALFHYIEVFYNRQRLHSSLRYQSPSEFARRYAQTRAVAREAPHSNRPKDGVNSGLAPEVQLALSLDAFLEPPSAIDLPELARVTRQVLVAQIANSLATPPTVVDPLNRRMGAANSLTWRAADRRHRGASIGTLWKRFAD